MITKFITKKFRQFSRMHANACNNSRSIVFLKISLVNNRTDIMYNIFVNYTLSKLIEKFWNLVAIMTWLITAVLESR